MVAAAAALGSPVAPLLACLSAQLFDLMTMGFKHQVLASSYPQELLHVTLNHLYQLRAKVEDAPAVLELVDDVISRCNAKYTQMTPLEFARVKQVRAARRRAVRQARLPGSLAAAAASRAAADASHVSRHMRGQGTRERRDHRSRAAQR